MDMETMNQLKEMAVEWLAVNGVKLLIAIIIIVVGKIIASKIARAIRTQIDKKGIDQLLAAFLQQVAFWTVMACVLLAAANHMGIDITSFIAILGTLGLAIGLAIKDNISNMANGVVLIITRPFTIGDFVQIAGVSGTVEAVKLSTTILKTPDNQRIIVPNAQILGTVITNVTGNDTRRIDLVIGVGYDDDIDATRNVLENVLKAESGILENPAYTIAVSELGDSSVNFVVRPWCRTEDYWNVRFRLIENIKKALDEASISIPYPHSEVYMHTVEN